MMDDELKKGRLKVYMDLHAHVLDLTQITIVDATLREGQARCQKE
jgi:hypothetical protein